MATAIYNTNDPYENLIARMISVERQPQLVLQKQKSAQEVYRAVLNDFDSALSALHASIERLTDVIANPFAARSATVPQGAGFGITATDAAVTGTHTLTVERLAATDTRVSEQLSKTGSSLRSFFDSNGVQTFDIQVASPTDEDPANRVSVGVTVLPVGTTDAEILAEIRQAITDAMASAVESGSISASEAASASVVNETSDTARLSIQSGATGFASRLSFSDSANGLLAQLDLDTTSVATGTGGGAMTDIGTSESDSALNARFLLDGLTLYRGSNEVDDAVAGLTFSLRATGSATTFSVGPDTDSITEEVNGFIQKYNAALDFIKRKSAVDAEAGTRGQFAGDSTIRSLRFGMRTDLIATVDGQPDGIARLADLGIKIKDDGTLELADKDALVAAVGRNPSAVQDLFASENGGLATRLAARLDRFLGANGTLDNRIESVDERIQRLDRNIAAWDVRLERREDVLRQQFARLQEAMALLQGQSDTFNSFYY